MEAGITSIGSNADDKGTFSIQQVVPCRYVLIAEQDGYLPSSTCLRGAPRRTAGRIHIDRLAGRSTLRCLRPERSRSVSCDGDAVSVEQEASLSLQFNARPLQRL